MVLATEADAARLYAWRLEPSTLAASRECRGVGFRDHLRWLASSLTDPSRRFFVIWLGQARIGSARLDVVGAGDIEMSLTLAPSARGQGLAVPVIQALCEAARDVFPACPRLLATIRQSNHASLRAFWEAGFRVWVDAPRGPNETELVFLELARRG